MKFITFFFCTYCIIE